MGSHICSGLNLTSARVSFSSMENSPEQYTGLVKMCQDAS
jgi:hypothetical protein